MPRTVCEAGSSLSRRCSSRSTPVRCHLPTRAVGVSRSFNSRAMAKLETKPAFRSSRIVGLTASARASAIRLIASPLLPWPDVIKPRRISTLATVVRCQLPPRAVGIPLRFNSFASAHWETKPVAISSRMVEARAAARESAACLSAEAAASIPRGRDEVTVLSCSIGAIMAGVHMISEMTARCSKGVSPKGQLRPMRNVAFKCHSRCGSVSAILQRLGGRRSG
jgi:hypothetical protein